MKNYKFEGLEILDMEVEERPCYCYFKVTSPDGKFYEVYTNKNLKGAFNYNEKTNNYLQTLGTAQFQIPKTKDGARKFLKKQLEKQLEF